MGVKNLWRLLLPTGHRLSIETLSHQTLAIDASIWMTQISKACRDPETGRLLPNKPHVRIFLLRLMRLLFHQIKPVVVFDGVMPEVKRREIRRRKDRRERLWRDDEDDGDGGTGGGGALKRAAKKILVKQLKEWREKEVRVKKQSGGVAEDEAKNDEANPNDENAVREAAATNTTQSSNGGAYAAGFTLADDSDEDANNNPSGEQSSNRNKNESDTNIAKTGDSDVISINSNDSEANAKQQFQSQLHQFQEQHHNGDEEGAGEQVVCDSENENDWEMSHAVQASINDSIQQSKKKEGDNNNDDHSDDENPFNDNHQQQQHHHQHRQQNQQQVSNETIASLPTEARSQWIDDQKSARRIESRQQCIEAAANPEDYSSIQLKNFLEGSLLNKRVGEISKLVESRKDGAELGGNNGNGGRIGGNAQKRSSRPILQRLRRHNNNNNNDDSDGDDHEDNEMFNSSAATSSTNRVPSMQVLFGEDDSDDEDEEGGGGGGGGFLVSAPSEPKSAPATVESTTKNNVKWNNDVVLFDNDNDDADGNSQSDSNEALETEPVYLKEESINTDHRKPSSSSSPKEREESTTTAAYYQRSKFMELSTAAQEWEQWGGDGDDDDEANEEKMSITEETDTNNCQRASTDHVGNNKGEVLDASASESDADDDEGGFLMLGQAARRLLTSPSMKAVTGATSATITDNANPLNSEDNEDEEDGDSDEIDWEDGDSRGDQVENVAGTGSDVDDHGDRASTDNDSSVEENVNAAMDSSKADDSTSAQKEAVKNDKHTEGTEGDKAIEIPSDDNFSLDRGSMASKDANPTNPSSAGNVNRAMPLTIDNSDESPSDNEFDSYHPDNEVTAALLQAQETASKLTDWAGRAFQRAISAHVGSQTKSGQPSRKEALEKEQIDLTVSDDVVAVATINREAEDSAETSASGKKGMVNGGQDQDSMPEQQKMPRKLDLFDTSLEGLNEAHNKIIEEEKAMERDMSTITDEMKEDILCLLRLCGIPWLESPSEAEAQCAALEELGLVDGVVTEDSDIFVFGGRKVYKNFFNEQKYVEAYFARDIERDLGLNKDNLVALAMLLGGDYTDGVKGVGIVNGMELLQAFPINDSADGIREGLQSFREWLDGFDEPKHNGSDKTYLSKLQLFHKKHKSARTRWIAPADFPSQAIINAYLKPVVDNSKLRFSFAKPDLPGLQQYCAETLGWEKEETDRVVNPVLKVLESGSKQTRLESYFMRYEDGVTFAKVRSKRLKAVLDDIQGASYADEDGKDMEGVDTEVFDEDSKPKKKRQRKKK